MSDPTPAAVQADPNASGLPLGERKYIVSYRVEDPHRQVGLNSALTEETAHARAAAMSASAPGDHKVQRRTYVTFLLTEDVAIYRDGEAERLL